MDKIVADLHMHTVYSDGNLTPSELQAKMKSRGLDYISITDHDTIAAYDYLDNSINVIMGVELTCYLNDREIHLLAYNFDPNHGKLKDYFVRIREQRDLRAESIIKQLQTKDVQVTFKELKNEFPTAILTRSHIAALLAKKGIVEKPWYAFRNLLANWHLNLPKVDFMTVKEAITTIKDAGGFTSLAHPGKYYSDLELYYMVKSGMRAIETYHPSHNPTVENKIQNFVKQYSILFTGGSDYHARNDKEFDFVGKYGLDSAKFKKLNKSMNLKIINS